MPRCRQRRHFFYLTGCNIPDSYASYEIDKERLVLFIPPVDPEDVIWSGMPALPKDAIHKYDVDTVLTTDKLKQHLSTTVTPTSTIFAIRDRADLTVFPSSNPAKVDLDHLRPAIEYSRVIKDDFEIALIRHANAISSLAHEEVLAAVHQASNERELNAIFLLHCVANGCREQAYGCICASGTNAATLHYVHNDLPLSGKLNLLLDAGGEYSCYCADITRTFPLNGRFSPESQQIYDMVLQMQRACMALIKAGMLWEDVHERAHQVAIEGLLNLGILKGDKEAIFDSRVSTVFFPHGLGHYLGMDTHDTGGDANYEDPDPMFRYLRVRGKVPAGAVITNEPGVYFCRFIIEPALKDPAMAKFIDEQVLERYWDVGGVRIEDDVLVLEGGCDNLTTVPSGMKEVEALINA